MPDDSDSVQSTTKIEEYHRLEIEEIFERTRALRSLRAQIGTFNATTSVTIVGVALSTQRAGLFFIAALSLAILIIVDVYVRRHVKACYTRGVQLEDKYASDADQAILHTDAVLIKEKAWVRRQSFGGFWLPLVFIPIELTAGLLLWLLVGWSLF